jgi:predicted RNA-binding Zn ribbon-like protein
MRVAHPALRFDAGAPWLDLLATVGGAYGAAPTERLRGVAELAAWLEHERLTPRQPPVDADVQAARALREALRRVALAVLGRQPVAQSALNALQPWLDRDEPVRTVARDGLPSLESPPTAAVALARVCRQAVEHLAGPERTHLGACADDECHMLFLDPTGRRRWCAAERCGVRARVRAHRARQVRGTPPARTAEGAGRARSADR